MDAYWRASNYLSVGQIYLLDNPLLTEPLRRDHIKPRLLGHWGTSPGLNMLYVHLNRVIKRDDLSMIYIIGPGHGGPSLVAHAYLEGTYCEVYPSICQDAEGLKKLFKQFSFPGGIPSHVAPETPGSIHEGGELGYSLSHAYGAAFDNPNLHVRGYKEEGSTTTPFDMVVLSDLDRFHLVEDVIDRLPQLGARAAYIKQGIHDKLIEHNQYIAQHGDDMPAISGWKWGGNGQPGTRASSTAGDNL